MTRLNVVHADEHLLVLDKPTGLLCVPGRGPDKADCLSARVQALYPDALIVHRLDMATSGLVVMGRGAAAQRALSLAFAERRVHKRYEAVVAGVPDASGADAEGWSDIHLPLIVDWPNRPKSKLYWEHGKPSHTQWRIQQGACLKKTTRVEMKPITGRTHQLRLHMAALGLPLRNDPFYPEVNDPPEGDFSRPLQLLAQSLEFTDPLTGELRRFESARSLLPLV